MLIKKIKYIHIFLFSLEYIYFISFIPLYPWNVRFNFLLSISRMLILTHFWLLYIEMILEKNIKTLWKINKQDDPRPPVCIHNSFFDRICRILTWALSLVLSLTSIRLKELWFTFYKEIEAQTCVKLGWEQEWQTPSGDWCPPSVPPEKN